MSSIVPSSLLSFCMTFVSCIAKESPQQVSKESSILIENDNKDMEIATFAGGCFWCTEAFFQRLKGVVKVTSGYSGGFVDNPTYEQVCDKTTGHAEVCQVLFDTTKISLDEILSVFWKTHDPTTLNQQGNDIGPQYRSVVFFHNKHQEDLAKKYINELNAAKAWPKPVVTTVEAFEKFYAAENYHQNYYNNNKNQGYCRYVIGPKLEKFEKVFADKLIKE